MSPRPPATANAQVIHHDNLHLADVTTERKGGHPDRLIAFGSWRAAHAAHALAVQAILLCAGWRRRAGMARSPVTAPTSTPASTEVTPNLGCLFY